MMKTLLILGLITISTGCSTIKVIVKEEQVLSVKQGQKFKAPFDGWFVSDYRMIQINKALEEKR